MDFKHGFARQSCQQGRLAGEACRSEARGPKDPKACGIAPWQLLQLHTFQIFPEMESQVQQYSAIGWRRF